MNSALKRTLVAMATAALSVNAACSSDSGPSATEASTGAEHGADAAAEGSCAEGSCGEGKCSEGSCGGASSK
ncbi:MAG: hypothetical protein AAF997_23375 [Myxococcota bacterium]